MKKCCDTCEFNFGGVCAGHGKRLDNGEDTYGMLVTDARKIFDNKEECPGWSISLGAYVIQEEDKQGRNAFDDEELVQLIRSSTGLSSEYNDDTYMNVLKKLEKLCKER